MSWEWRRSWDFWALQVIMFKRRGKVWEELLGWLFVYLLKLFWTIQGKDNIFLKYGVISMDVKTRTGNYVSGTHMNCLRTSIWDLNIKVQRSAVFAQIKATLKFKIYLESHHLLPSLLVLILPLSILHNLSPRILLWVDNWSLLHIASAFAFLSVSSPKLAILLKYICKTMVLICTKLPIWQRTEPKILVRTYEIQRDFHIDI